MANLTPEQRTALEQWAADGATLNDVQQRLKAQFDVSLTYLDARLLLLELQVKLKDKPRDEPKPEEPAPIAPQQQIEDAALPNEAAPRTPSWDYGTQHHHWLVSEKVPLTPALITFSDQLHARRLRATMSVDDIVAAVFTLLQDKGLLENTYVIYS